MLQTIGDAINDLFSDTRDGQQDSTPEKNTTPSAVCQGMCIPRQTEYVKYAFRDIPGASAIG